MFVYTEDGALACCRALKEGSDVQSEFARDLADPNGPIEAAARERPGKTIRIRIQPMILREAAGRGGQYRAWKDIAWTLGCQTPAEAFALRDAMIAFFEALSRVGGEQVAATLTALRKGEAA